MFYGVQSNTFFCSPQNFWHVFFHHRLNGTSIFDDSPIKQIAELQRQRMKHDSL